jgi:hypothetical protein
VTRGAKVAIGLAVVGALAALFVRSARESRSAPYAIPREHLAPWSVAVESPSTPDGPVLVLRPPRELQPDLFRQLFARVMESMTLSPVLGIPLVLQGESDRAFAGRMTPDDLAAAAREAGLETFLPQPQCVGYRRISEPGVTRQLYFLLFTAPAFEKFRNALAQNAQPEAMFDPAALSPVLLIAQSGPPDSWLPLRVDPAADCVATIDVQ